MTKLILQTLSFLFISFLPNTEPTSSNKVNTYHQIQVKACQHDTTIELKFPDIKAKNKNLYSWWVYKWPESTDWLSSDPKSPPLDCETAEGENSDYSTDFNFCLQKISESDWNFNHLKVNSEIAAPTSGLDAFGRSLAASAKSSSKYSHNELNSDARSSSLLENTKHKPKVYYNQTSIKSLKIYCNLYQNDNIMLYLYVLSHNAMRRKLLKLANIAIYFQPIQVKLTTLIPDNYQVKTLTHNFNGDVNQMQHFVENTENYVNFALCSTFSKPECGFLWKIKSDRYKTLPHEETAKFEKNQTNPVMLNSKGIISIPLIYKYHNAEITCSTFFTNEKTFYEFKDLSRSKILKFNFPPEEVQIKKLASVYKNHQNNKNQHRKNDHNGKKIQPISYKFVCDNFANPAPHEYIFNIYLLKAVTLPNSNHEVVFSYIKQEIARQKFNQIKLNKINKICNLDHDEENYFTSNVTSLEYFSNVHFCILECTVKNSYGINNYNLRLVLG